MQKQIVLAMFALVLIVGCATTPTAQPAATATAESKPLALQGQPTLPPEGKQGTLPAPGGQNEATPTYVATVTNPTGKAKLYVAVYAPKGSAGKKLPALVLVPGGTGDSSGFVRPNPRGDTDVAQYNNAGIVAVVFDPDGRGKSEGKEDYNGHTHQDGLAAVIRYAATLNEVDPRQIGVATFSYGITMGSGALARYTDLPVKYLIDWEGPADRNYTTTGCGGQSGRIAWEPCSNNAWWSEREAVSFIGKIRVPYQRVQSQKDHVQPENSHAVKMINAAVKGGVSWVRLNDYPANQTYDEKNPPKMFPETMDAQLEQMVARYAVELNKR